MILRDDFTPLPIKGNLTVAFIDGGKATLIISDVKAAVLSPCVLLLSTNDDLLDKDNDKLLMLQDALSKRREPDALSGGLAVSVALEYVHANYAKNITLDNICNYVYINRTTLTRKFKMLTGRSPMDYLLFYRLTIACELLTHSKLSIKKIAESTGFNCNAYFCKQFKSKIGITPSEYRKSEGFETINTNEYRIVEEF